LGGVLIDNTAKDLIDYCAKVLNVSSESLKKVFTNYEISFMKGIISENELWGKVCKTLGANVPQSDSLWKDAVRNVFKDKPEVYNLVLNLKTNGYKLGFLSNTEIPTMQYFHEMNYDKYFDAIVFSCAEQTVKPEEKIYSVCLEKLGVKPNEAIFIDDRIDYVEGARKVGITAILFVNIEQLKRELFDLSVTIN